jgi:hypothetical protein
MTNELELMAMNAIPSLESLVPQSALAPFVTPAGQVRRMAVVPIGFLDFVRNAPVQSGVCCCGSPMVPANHGDHVAVDQWDHSLSMWLEQIGAVQ